MKQYNFYFEDSNSRVIVASTFINAYGALTQTEKETVKTVYSCDVTVVD